VLCPLWCELECKYKVSSGDKNGQEDDDRYVRDERDERRYSTSCPPRPEIELRDPRLLIVFLVVARLWYGEKGSYPPKKRHEEPDVECDKHDRYDPR